MTKLKLDKILVENFRNLAPRVFEFSPTINCIFGPNGNGKTNLLEAVHWLVHRKSFRKNTSYPQILNIEGDKREILFSALFLGKDEYQTVSGKLREDGDEWWVNNRPEKTKLNCQCVFVNPFDSYSFHTSSTFRRQWIDGHFSLLSKDYKSALGRFQKALRFRNSLLAQGMSSQGKIQLQAIDEQFCQLSAYLLSQRVQFLQDINQFSSNTFREIFSEEHELLLQLETRFSGWDQSKFYEFYRSRENEDFSAGQSNVGIHRDDYIFYFDGLNSFEFCSLGQQKMSYLSLVFAFIELFRSRFESYPIVLIDDVSGELDSQRWKNLIQYLEQKMFQVLITTANENFRLELEKIPQVKRIFIEQGIPQGLG